VTKLWEATLGANQRLDGWARRGSTELHVARLPRPAWPIVAGSLARAITERGRTVLVLVSNPARFADELRIWLAGRPVTHVFAEIGVSFLDRPPAFDEATNRRLEALTALVTGDKQPVVVVSSRRAMTRQTISHRDLVDTTVVLKPGEVSDPVAIAGRLVELGYSREPLVEERAQFSLRGGILDVFPAAADEPVRAEWSGEAIETLRIFDPENQRSVMGIDEAVIRTGRELLIGPDRGRAAVERLRQSVSLESLRGDVRSEW
jgi:transcription-repair coupling factor (superfamily II helicase)